MLLAVVRQVRRAVKMVVTVVRVAAARSWRRRKSPLGTAQLAVTAMKSTRRIP